MKATDLQVFQSTYEQRFGCCICLGPKLHMVSGQCQHRICDDCLYVDKERRPCMEKCPVCGMENSFPHTRPIIPAQVIEIQRCIGVQECPNGCAAQMWYWEVEDHTRNCPRSCKSPEKVVTPRRRRSRVADRGCVSTTIGTPRLRNKRPRTEVHRRLRPRQET
ncbi:TNF receptor-associated factor 6-like [Mercenaria mercenaria]|uniref:TNF receptor-associated factor 6-like n=1 Tax=Mercenaria mercenaria TaxID=6596 RepID=UPI00234F1EF8|nr:TNF receptor-associated factor 6-like [Mercenaria mercenaria]